MEELGHREVEGGSVSTPSFAGKARVLSSLDDPISQFLEFFIGDPTPAGCGKDCGPVPERSPIVQLVHG
ncbi:hypothetical protein A6F55_19820 [Prescottella equi]|nr:hypothetical protein A6F55_19820 [Prescottella equi]BCN63269.1 hypothetical protein RE9431_17240 [Prescottella equi]BCN73121.1 hypothetical protein RE0327_17200 [Prescottella equi]